MSNLKNSTKPILVLGIGNILKADDGVGVHAIEKMRDEIASDEVEVFDGGTAGLDLLSVVASRRMVLVVDAVDGGGDPGTLYRFTPEDISDTLLRWDSLHQVGLLETLRMALLTGRGPKETIIIGVQPEVVDWGLSLSPTVAGQLPRLIDRVKLELEIALSGEKNINENKC